MKYSLKTIGLFQAAGLVIYVSFFASVIQFISQSQISNLDLQPIVGVVLFLLTFIISALVCGSIVFAYPITLFFDNKKDEAYKIVLWSLGWLLAFFALLVAVIFSIFSFLS